MTRTKAFTLIEFLLSAAVLAVFASILFPITARAQGGGGRASTITNLRLIGSAANQYANDYDTVIVRTQQTETDVDRIWNVALSPYLSNRSVFFDPARPVPTGTSVTVMPGTVMPWYRVVNLSINDAGYTGHWVNLGNTCGGRRIGYQLGGRSMATMAEPNQRVAFAPTTWGGTNVGWNVFHGNEASWINAAHPATAFSWNNMVYNTRTLYPEASIPVVRADGSAGKLTRGDFVDTTQAANLTAYCSWMNAGGNKAWGSFWKTD